MVEKLNISSINAAIRAHVTRLFGHTLEALKTLVFLVGRERALVGRRQLHGLAGKMRVEVRSVRLRRDGGHKGRGNLAPLELVEVDTCKVRVLHHLEAIPRPTPKPELGITHQQLGEQALRKGRERGGEQDGLGQDVVEEAVPIAGRRREGQLARLHLEHDDTQPPPVHSPPVLRLLQHLGCKILGGTTEGGGGGLVRHFFLAQTEIGDLGINLVGTHSPSRVLRGREGGFRALNLDR
jgi:hypothetical protein